MEYCDKGDLGRYLKNNKLSYGEKLGLISQLISGMKTLYLN